MRKEKSVLSILAILLGLIVAWVVFFVVLRGGFHGALSSTISSDQLLAEADKYQIDKYQTGNGLPVKLGLVGDGPPIVYVTRLNSNESLAAYASCAPKPTPPTAPQVKCWQGYTLFTTLTQRWMDAGTSIQEIDKMLEAVQHLLDTDLNKRTSIDGLSVFVIPGGKDTNPGFTSAQNIEMKCLRDRARPETPGAVMPIGRQTSESTTLFDNAPRSFIVELEAMKKLNAETNAKIEPKLASDDAKLTDSENISLIKTALSVHSALSGRHIGVAQKMLNRHYSTLVQAKIPLHVQAYLARDKNGNTINCNSSVGKAAKAVAWAAGFGGDFFLTNLKIDELGYTKVCMPDKSLLKKLKEDIQAHVERLQKLRAGHAARQKTFAAQLKDLVAKDYNCPI